MSRLNLLNLADIVAPVQTDPLSSHFPRTRLGQKCVYFLLDRLQRSFSHSFDFDVFAGFSRLLLLVLGSFFVCVSFFFFIYIRLFVQSGKLIPSWLVSVYLEKVFRRLFALYRRPPRPFNAAPLCFTFIFDSLLTS